MLFANAVTDFFFHLFSIFQVPSFEFLCEKLQMYQRQYNDYIRGSFLDLVFFKDAMTHIIKVWDLLLFY